MRTKTLLLTAALVAAGVASSMAQGSNVYSLNIVGYVNVPVQANRLYILNNPLDDGKGNVITNVLNLSFDNNNLDGSTVFTFDQVNGFVAEGWEGFLTNWAPGVAVLAPGTGFFFQPSADDTITFVGSVTLTNSLTLKPGLNLVGSAYPASTNVTALGFTGQDQDEVLRFFSTRGSEGAYGNGATFEGFLNAWIDGDAPDGEGPVTGPSPNVAEGFFYLNAQSANELVSATFTVN